jgi:Family of unknown function (DUF5947)
MSASFLAGDRGDRSAAPIGALRRFAQKREPERAPGEVEHCELCSEIIPKDHRHLLDLSSRALICACQACSLLFSDEGSGGGKYRLVPRRYLSLIDFQMTNQQWDELMIPVNMAFIFRSSGSKHVMAFYPSPAGATESLLDLEGWEMLASSNPVLLDLVPDVEALLINRVKNAREHYIVPIDACYELVGLIRLSWKGLSGGTETWEAIGEFFENIRAKSRPVKGDQDA